jgi:single-stranded-DNA-specific exonuclease
VADVGSAAPAPRDSVNPLKASIDPLKAGELGRAWGVSPVIAQLLIDRGVGAGQLDPERFLHPKLAHLTAPDAMADRGIAAQRIAHAVRTAQRVVVFGDYDVDGTTSATILAGVIASLGGNVTALVGNRFDGGYGLSDAALGRVLAERPALLITCDCGSSDHARVAKARAAGVDVIVVDHHLVPAEPLAAMAFLNPHRPECGFPYKGLCSAGLALSLGAALRSELKANIDLRQWLDLVALGTIADVAPLDGDNRALVRAGLAALTAESARPGVIALREAAKLRPGTPISAIDVAFRLTPRLNAAGRLGDPAVTLALLRSRDLYEARALAAQIERLNTERKEIEQRVTAGATAQVELHGVGHGLVAASTDFHRGVVGISAARLVDRFDRPALVVAIEGESGHGSGRAPDGFPLHAALVRVSHLLDKFGGHDAAVGFSLRRDRVDALRVAFDQACAELAPRKLEADGVAAAADARLGEGHYALPLASELMLLEPLGEKNPEPVFEVFGEVLRAHVVGDGHLKLSLFVAGRELSAFGYQQGPLASQLAGRVCVRGTLRPDAYRGAEQVELRIESCRVIEPNSGLMGAVLEVSSSAPALTHAAPESQEARDTAGRAVRQTTHSSYLP